MPLNGYNGMPLKQFGGLNTLLDATNLPTYQSPDCADVEFVPGLVRTRPGLVSQFPILTGNPSVNYIKTYVTNDESVRMLALDSLGVLRKEDPQGTLNIIGSIENPGAIGQSVSLFGQEYMAFGDNENGLSIPRHFDDVNLDRVSQVGPGAGPTVSDYLPPPATIATPTIPPGASIAASPTGAVTSDPETIEIQVPGRPPIFTTINTKVTITTTTNHGFSVGQQIVISGVTGTTGVTFNGTYTVSDVISPTVFKYSRTNGKSGTGGGGTAGIAGSSIARTGNVATVSTSAPHGFVAHLTVIISGIPNITLGGTITSIVRATGVVTVVTASPTGLVPGSVVNIQGITGDLTLNGLWTVSGIPNATTFTFLQAGLDGPGTVSGSSIVQDVFNGTFLITSVPTTTTFTYANIGPDDATTSGGTATILGNVSAGNHQVAVCFILRSEYITAPSPPVNFIAGGGKNVFVSDLPIGPSNVIARRLLFTPFLAPGTTLGSFSFIPGSFDVLDNTSTSVILDFSDSQLETAENFDSQFDLLELGECSGVTEYDSRLFWWGERNKLNNFVNLTFDGGWDLIEPFVRPSDVPLGWTPDPAFAIGGSRETVNTVFGDAYKISGDGATAIRGLISQSAFQDVFADPIIEQNVAYSARVKLRMAPVALTQGVFHIDLFSPSLGTTIGPGLSVSFSNLTSNFVEFIQTLCTEQAKIPTDLVLRVYVDGTPNNGGGLIADNIEVFPTAQPFLSTVVRASGVEDPESYDGVDGFLVVAPENGQSVRCVFRLRDWLYIVKERSLFVTADDGQNEPAQWGISETSANVGTLSPRGVGLGDEWAVIAGEKGLYHFSGGFGGTYGAILGGLQSPSSDASKLSQEIQPTWDSINWSLGELIDVKVDLKKKHVLIAAPFGSSTVPNMVLMLDYTEGFGDPAQQQGYGRKWSIWNISTSAIGVILRSDGTEKIFFGNNTATGKIYQLTDGAGSDDGAPIGSYWQSGFFQGDGENIPGTRLTWGYISANVMGTGALNMVLRKGDQQSIRNIRGWTLQPNAFHNFERQIEQDVERLAIRFAGGNFSLQGLFLYFRESAWKPARGVNS